MSGAPRGALVDGVVLGAAFTVVAVVSLLVDPTVRLEVYPPDVRAAVGAPTASTGLGVAVALALVVVPVSGIAWSLLKLDREVSGASAPAAALHVCLLFWIVNAVDIVVVDWIFFMELLGSRVVLPGTEGMAGCDDHLLHHRRSFLTAAPWIASIVLSVGVGVAWWALVDRRRGRRRRGHSPADGGAGVVEEGMTGAAEESER